MRTPKEKRTDMDYTVPIDSNDFNLDEQDCFGNMWDIRDKMCGICADNELCMIIYQDKIKKQKMQFDNSEKKSLDMGDFNKVNWKKIVELVVKLNNEGNPLTYEELFEAIKSLSNITEKSILDIYITSNIPVHNLYIKDNYVLPLFA